MSLGPRRHLGLNLSSGLGLAGENRRLLGLQGSALRGHLCGLGLEPCPTCDIGVRLLLAELGLARRLSRG